MQGVHLKSLTPRRPGSAVLLHWKYRLNFNFAWPDFQGLRTFARTETRSCLDRPDAGPSCPRTYGLGSHSFTLAEVKDESILIKNKQVPAAERLIGKIITLNRDY